MGKGAVVIDLSFILKCLVLIAYFIAIIAGIVSLVDVGDTAPDPVIQTCDKAGLKGRDCVRNINGYFAVAVVAAVVILFAAIGAIAEFGFNYVRENIRILTKAIGRAFYMIVIGTLALGIAGDLGIAAGISMIVVGVLVGTIGLCLKSNTQQQQ